MQSTALHSDPRLRLTRVGTDELAANEEVLVQAVTLLLGTYPGTRPMLRAYGCNLLDLLFEPLDENTGRVIAHRIDQAIARWCPEVTVSHSQIQVLPDPEIGGFRIVCPLHLPTGAYHNLKFNLTR